MIGILNTIISGLALVLTSTISLLPTSPFNFVLSIDNQYVQAMNWVIPFPGMVAHLSVFLVAVMTYVLVRIPLRWIKAVQ